MILAFLPSCRRHGWKLTTRACSSSAALNTDSDLLNSTSQEHTQDAVTQQLLHPSQFATNGVLIPMIDSLSPSSMSNFRSCKQAFLFQYLWKLKQPTNKALIKGTLCHAALESFYEFDPKDRNLELLQNLFRKRYAAVRNEHLHLFNTTVTSDDNNNTTTATEEEITWGKEALELLANFARDMPDLVKTTPAKREVWVKADLQDADDNTTFKVRGIVDRIDSTRDGLRIVDYKSGRAPELKYTAAVNQRILRENFFPLQTYAYLWRLMHPESTHVVQSLQLAYLAKSNGKATVMEMDVEDAAHVRAQLINVYQEIKKLVATQDPLQFHGCQKSQCYYCNEIRSKFEPGTVWEPQDSSSDVA
jgi:RecB family exonuclease